MGAVVGQCPPPGELDRLLTEQLSGQERDALEAHIEDCSSCQERLDHLVGTSPALSAAPAGARPDVAGHAPDERFLDRLKKLPTRAAVPGPTDANWIEHGQI